MKKISACILALAVLCGVLTLPRPAHAQTRKMDDIRVFAVYEPVISNADIEILRAVRPDLVCRGWFRWRNARDWAAMSPLADACRAAGIVLQGGTTVSAVYPGENGIDDATFQDFVTRSSATGEPYRVGGDPGWYQLSIYNPKVIDYIKRDVRRQIDAGAEGIWYDEVEGYFDWVPTAGYDAYTVAAFRDWLIAKYVDGQGWKENDARWQTVFNIDLARYGGTIRKFDYLRHLQTTMGADGKPLATNPPQGNPREWAKSPNPLHREWGYAWNRAAKGTFRFDTVTRIFADLVADADEYARRKYGRTLINTYNHNGTARPGVAFLQPHNGGQPPVADGRLDARGSYIEYYEKVIADAADAGANVPVVFFVDWPGEADRLTALPRGDQLAFFAAYIPEAYAAGGEFALPLRGYSYLATQHDTLGYLALMVDFYREYFPWLRGSHPVPGPILAPEKVTARLRRTESGSVLHLISHRVSGPGQPTEPLTGAVVEIPWSGDAPAAAIVVSPDWPEQRAAAVERIGADRLRLTLPEIVYSALVLLPKQGALKPVSGRAADGSHILADGARAMAIAEGGRFTLWTSPDVKTLSCLETGEQHPVRKEIAFASPSGGFAEGRLVDSYGVPLRAMAIRAGGKTYRTDFRGQYRIPLSAGVTANVAIGDERDVTIPIREGFTVWGTAPRDRWILDPAARAGVGGFWANWADREKTPEALRIAREMHAGKSAVRFDFLPVDAPWRNANSPRLDTRGMTDVEVTWAGDGTTREVRISLQALGLEKQRFYHATLPLSEKGWTTRRLPLSSFLDDEGNRYPDDARGTVVFQVANRRPPTEPLTVWIHSLRLTNEGPALRALRQGDTAPPE